MWAVSRVGEGKLGIRGTQTKPEESEMDYMDTKKRDYLSNQVKAENRVHVLTLNPSLHVL